ncbi:MAG: IS110 family transposase [Actinomycetota bacterium]|nr:IS110 family transposase [Actinomycetota bacterium]
MLERINEIGREERELLAELTGLIDAHAPQLLAQPGCGTVTAVILIGHNAGAQRFPTDGHFARHAGTAPVPASSGNTQRHRPHRGGDRQLNRAIHIIAISRARTDPAIRTPANKPGAKPSSKPSAASNDTSPAASGACSTPPQNPPGPPVLTNRSNPQIPNITS